MTDSFKIRDSGINYHHWYVVARSAEVKNQPVTVRLWKQDIVLYRNSKGNIQALADSCPHRRVKLSQGQVVGDDLECAYHGWRFNGAGKCTSVPYLLAQQKLPPCRIPSYPVQEKQGFIWICPHLEAISVTASLDMPEWDDLNYIASVALIDCRAHYSFLIENLMDMYHGHLHRDYQAWVSAILQEVKVTPQRVDAYYQAQSYYRIDKIWSVAQLFFPPLRRLHAETLQVSYIYPHWVSSLGQDFRIYCLFCPVDETHTRAYLVHYTSLQAFWRLQKLPVWWRRWLKNRLFGCAQGLLKGLIRQDIVMIEQEQQAYLSDSQSCNYELNPTIKAVQNLIRVQLED